jgi:mannosyltransferase OCH1-like enzyme
MKIIIIFIILILLILVLIYYFKYNKKEKFTLNYQRRNIPKVLYLTYKTKDIPPSVINKFKEVYPNYEIKIYDNNDCIDFLSKEYGQEYVDIFNFIKDGPIKADFWRVCILYKYGGIYSDVDIVPIINIEEILESDTTFLTCVSKKKDNTNPHFIVSIPKHKILKLCIDTYLDFYRNNIKYSYWEWSITKIMKNATYTVFNKYINKDGVYYDSDNNKYQFLKEASDFILYNLFPSLENVHNFGKHGAYCKYNNTKILYIKNDNYAYHQFI